MSTFSPNLAIQLIATGDQAGQWGLTTNTNLGTLIESAISGYVTQAFADANVVLPMPPGADGGNGSVANPVAARNMFITCSGTNTAQRSLFVPNNTKLYFISNQTTGGFGINVTTVGGSGVVVPSGLTALLVCNGVNVVNAVTYLPALTAPVSIAAPANPTAVSLTVTGASNASAVVISQQSSASPGLAIVSPNNIQASLEIGQVGIVAWLLYNPPNSTDLRLFQTVDRVIFGAQGNTTFLAPGSGTTVDIETSGGGAALDLNNQAGTLSYMAYSIGSVISAFTGTGALISGAGINDYAIRTAGGAIDFSVNNGASSAVVIGSNGTVTVASSSSGYSVNVNAPASSLFSGGGMQIVAPNIASQSIGMRIIAGTNVSDAQLILTNGAQNLNYWIFYGDGGLVTSGLTSQGAGSANLAKIFLGNNQIYSGVPPSASTTISRADNNMCVVATGTITVPNGVFLEGDCVSVYNDTGASITISAGIATMRLVGTAVTGSRTLAQRGMATIWFRSGTECVVSGGGLS